jgi:hypothetical protein
MKTAKQTITIKQVLLVGCILFAISQVFDTVKKTMTDNSPMKAHADRMEAELQKQRR